VRLAYRLARTRATGVLTVFAHPPRVDGLMREPGCVLVLRRGHLMAADVDASGSQHSLPAGVPLGRRTARRLEHLASLEDGRFYFDGGVAAYPPGALLRQYNLAAWARTHLEAQFDAAHAQSMLRELAGTRLVLRLELAPDPAWCDEVDRRILAAMAVPRRLDQIWPLARTARFRLLSFLHFLRSVGAVVAGGVAAPPRGPRSIEEDAYRLLGVPSGADRETVKRAYRRLARALHPDLHGDSSDERRRQLERKLADINCAYRRLVDSSASV
jgi:DnaJ-domain-containing protein 1